MEKVLITGGLGFIGLNVAYELVQRSDVQKVILLDNLSVQIHGDIPILAHSVIGHPKVFVQRVNINQVDALVPYLDEITSIIHLASETGTAQSMYKISHYNNINSQGTALMLQTLTDHKHKVGKIVLASSRSVYGEGAYICPQCGVRYFPKPRTHKQLLSQNWDHRSSSCVDILKAVPTREDDNVNPASIYAVTKYAQEELIRVAGEALNITTTILRFQNVYGEGQSLHNPYTGILSILSTKMRQGTELPVYEDGTQSRDFIHVEDVAHSVVLSLIDTEQQSNLYNVGSGKASTIYETVKLLSEQFDYQQEPIVTGQFRVGDIRNCFADISKIQRDLGFVPRVSLDQGLYRFAQWVKDQPLPDDNLDKANHELRERGLMS